MAGVRKTCEVRLDDLPPAARRGVRHAFASSRGRGLGRDLKTYRLTLAEARGIRDVLLDEASVPLAARPLVRYLSQRASPGSA
ncbi:MAG: hypothetical protein IPP35_12390 [Elusimicrobia bacterium]|nr:hypothetical protein [Elusimicrobiota bacterium]